MYRYNDDQVCPSCMCLVASLPSSVDVWDNDVINTVNSIKFRKFIVHKWHQKHGDCKTWVFLKRAPIT